MKNGKKIIKAFGLIIATMIVFGAFICCATSDDSSAVDNGTSQNPLTSLDITAPVNGDFYVAKGSYVNLWATPYNSEEDGAVYSAFIMNPELHNASGLQHTWGYSNGTYHECVYGNVNIIGDFTIRWTTNQIFFDLDVEEWYEEVLNTGSITLHVVKVVNSTVSFDANGGSCGTSSATANNGSSITLPAASKSEYTFKGWYTAASGGTRVGGAGDAYSVNSNTTLYAQYDAIPVSISSSQGNYSMVRGNTFSYTVNCNLSGCSISVSGANWLSVNGTTITGTPSAAGDYSITVTAAKAGHTSATQTFTIHVADLLVFTSSPSSGFIVVS